VALAGQTGYEPSSTILATNVYIGGIQLPYVETSTSPDGLAPFGTIGVPVRGFPVQQSPPEFNYLAAEFGDVSGEIRFPIRGDPMPGNIGKTRRLSAGEVTDIISNAASRAGITRAGIRLPVGVPAEVFIAVVGNPGLTGKPPPILRVFRTGEATVFNWDVAVQKARTAYIFSNDELVESCRTVGFLAQRYYPPGIDGTNSVKIKLFEKVRPSARTKIVRQLRQSRIRIWARGNRAAVVLRSTPSHCQILPLSPVFEGYGGLQRDAKGRNLPFRYEKLP